MELALKDSAVGRKPATFSISCNFDLHEMKIQMIDGSDPSQKSVSSASGSCVVLNNSSVHVPSDSFPDSSLNIANQLDTFVESESAQMEKINTGHAWNSTGRFSKRQKEVNADCSDNFTSKSSNDESFSTKDSSSCLFICQIVGSPPKIKRIFTTYPRSLIESALENSLVSDIEIIGGKYSQEMIDKIASLGERSPSNREETNSEEPETFDADFSDADSSQEDFSHLVEVVETFEDVPLSIEEEKNGRRSVEEVYKPLLCEDLASHQTSGELTGIRIAKKSSVVRNFSRKREKTINQLAQPSKEYQPEDSTCFEVKRGPFECDICHNFFSSKYSVRDHILAKHPPSENLSDNRPFQCEKCAQAFVRKSYLNEHLRMAHSEQPRYPCPSCPKKFKRKKYLEYHILRAHSNSKPLLCQHCGAAFSLVFALNEHVRYHHSDGFKCNDCGKVFKRSSTLIIHSRPRAQGPKPICRYCKETFINKCSLQVHILNMHSDVYQYPCQSCDLKFTLKRTLISHMKLVHDAVRNHPCPLCDKFFKNTAGVRVHLNNVHNHERNFKCGLCGRSFKTRQVYNEHMALQHPM